jgi:hypothetical protein
LKLKDIYKLFVSEGIKEELRTAEQVRGILAHQRALFKKLKASRKRYFDRERLHNPYSDTRILNGHPETDVKRILVGIDIDVSELLLAQHLSQNSEPVDLVLAHHPEGHALSGLYDVMNLQTDVFKNLGVEDHVAQDLMKKRIVEIERKVHSANFQKVVDAAKLLDIPLMCCHTPADNHVAKYLQKIMDQNPTKTLDGLVDLLLKEPEYKHAASNDVGPKIFHGKPKDKAGRVFVDMTGGTSGSKEIFSRLSQIGVKTLLGMHVSESHFSKLKSEYINIIVAGHMASDSLGLNLLFDKLVKKANISILECSGYRRFSRLQKKKTRPKKEN